MKKSLQDKFNRDINYLRISVTDKCNLRCTYCMPKTGIPRRPHSDFLSIEKILKITKAAVEMGITKIRITGGEPLIKKGIISLVKSISQINGVDFIGMTTNGVLLDKYASPLKKAGISRLNISLDTLNPEKYKKITRIGELKDCLKGIQTAQKLKIPIKINMVVFDHTTEDDIKEMQVFCKLNKFDLQLIKEYNLTRDKIHNLNFDRPPKCHKCNRIRLLADGIIKPCLHSNKEIKVDLKDIRGSIEKAISEKPMQGDKCTNRNIFEIGG